MQTKRIRPQPQLRLMPPLEAMVREDYPLRRLNRLLDLSFVHETVRDRYCQDNGRPSIDSEVIIRLFLLQAIAGIPHVRELLRAIASLLSRSQAQIHGHVYLNSVDITMLRPNKRHIVTIDRTFRFEFCLVYVAKQFGQGPADPETCDA